ncbi:cysteinyl-tRNA synthetase [Cotonvirus japonicus]|uniref:Cysteinyl-tRNA synthetase n=1 Tax=Cotonvirus japonicus TaxID=2811091 RepID=A0ABM7NTM2_9VIRU|nr:cysteinyl-tRNA synthetase [Cotonvirus japonicus]BCS83514.1 cysteinyl-tRNA synthetase [Cotonvirus japonicus]
MEHPSPRIMKMYVCGPTVYSDSHIGHARIYIIVDIINKTLNNILNKPTHLVMNITDIDDKIIKAAQNKNINWVDLAHEYENSYFNAMTKLGVSRPDVVIRVSESIPDIVKYIQKIIDNNMAYIVSDGSVYFDSNQYKNFGYEFSEIDDIEEQQYESQVDINIISQKKHHKDFALWKSRLITDVGFDVEFLCNNSIIKTRGVPGWHIECSAMIQKTLGDFIDVHFGGIDLKFPHHHNECLQANAYHHPIYNPLYQQQNGYFSKWTHEFVHIGHLCVKGQKMSKSLKNFSTISEIMQHVNANQLRWLFMINKWEKPMEFTNGCIDNAISIDNIFKNFIKRVTNFTFDISDVIFSEKEFELQNFFYTIKDRIFSYLEKYKFNSVVKALHSLITQVNLYMDKLSPNESIVSKIKLYIVELLEKLGFYYQINNTSDMSKHIMNVLIETRSQFRQLTRDKSLTSDVKECIFKILDDQRNTLLPSIGITLEDTKDSSFWCEITNQSID